VKVPDWHVISYQEVAMEGKSTAGNFRLTVPLDASAVEGFKPDKAVKVVVRDGKGGLHSQMAKLDEKGQGAAKFTFSGNPGTARVVLGPEDASDKEMMGLQTIAVDIAAGHWKGEELTLSPVAISPYYWWWWWRWCQTFTIHGRVVCPSGNPVPGATVCAYDVDGWWWWLSEDLVGCATTDVTGSFTLTFRRCCGWWPWWWWVQRVWRLAPDVAKLILPVLEQIPNHPPIPIPDPAPDLSLFTRLLGEQGRLMLPALGAKSSAMNKEMLPERPMGAGGSQPSAFDPSILVSLRERLIKQLPVSPELERLRLWPWSPWEPWWDCDPDILFKVKQNCHGQEVTIVNETLADTRWDIPTTLNVTLVANDKACCAAQGTGLCCPDGNAVLLSDACSINVGSIGDNPPLPGGLASPTAGYVTPGTFAAGQWTFDRPFGGSISVFGCFGDLAGIDYYEFEWSTDGASWNTMPPAAAGGFYRSHFIPPTTWTPVPFLPTTITDAALTSHFVIESRAHYEANNGPQIWDAFTFDLIYDWLTENNFADGTYQLRLKGWTRPGYSGVLTNPTIPPLCGTQNENGMVLTVDNRFIAAGPLDAHGHPCGTGTVHTCTAEPETDFIAVSVGGHTVNACSSVDGKLGGPLVIDFIAHDPDGHLAYYTLHATYGDSQDIDLLDPAVVPSGTLTVLSAAQIGPFYGDARIQGAAAPTWAGGTYRLTITNIHEAFPITCCYQLELSAYKRTIVSCDGNPAHANLSEYSFGVAY
jgi:hypothetical protein